MIDILVTVIVFCAAFVQTLSGFGFALIVMPLLTLVIGLKTSAPLVALVGLTLYTVNLIRYRQAINGGELLRLALACALGVPVGIRALIYVDESIVKPAMGLILIAYAVYTLVSPAARSRSRSGAQRQVSRWWVYPAGFAAGCLGGAYNTPGPPVIAYGSLRQWPKEEFRAVLQALFFISGVLVVASHALAHNLTARVLTSYLYAMPASLLGILAGTHLDAKLNPGRFRTLVKVMILILGLSLLFS